MEYLSNIRKYFTLQMLLMLLFGFSCGLPLTLTGMTLSTYLKDINFSIQAIGLFSIVALPYSLKPLWSPLIDNIKLPYVHRFGQRKSWLLLSQILLITTVLIAGFIETQIKLMVFIFCLVAFFSASQDIIVDALRIETLRDSEQGLGSANYGLGYRLGILCASMGMLYLAEIYSWQVSFIYVAMCLSVSVIATFIIKEPQQTINKRMTNFRTHIMYAYVQPFIEFSSRRNWLIILLLIATYKLSDAYLGALTGPFLLEMGFTKIEIANIVKFYGMIATIAGGYLGGYLAKKYSDKTMLSSSAVLGGLSNLLFVIQYQAGYNIAVLISVISIENFISNIGSTVLIVYLSKLCNKEFTITQYALLSSLTSIGKNFISSTSGIVQSNLGWTNFFIFSALLTLPVLILLKLLNYRENICK